VSSQVSWLSVTQQAIRVAGKWPGQPRPRVRRGALEWVGQLQPTSLSPSYTVSLTYKTGSPPKVHIRNPILDPGLREALPHVYEGDRLCLYTPGEWDESMWLSETIIPWTAEWLFHYEIWRATGRWEGGGHAYAESDRAPAK
jgi:hypothetical protein